LSSEGSGGSLLLAVTPHGRVRPRRLPPHLIIAGRATPSAIVSHELPLTEAPAAYEKFDKRVDGYTKVILHAAA
jgi:threonine dehydrogenase-like Zn-dependent dehydrogenase